MPWQQTQHRHSTHPVQAAAHWPTQLTQLPAPTGAKIAPQREQPRHKRFPSLTAYKSTLAMHAHTPGLRACLSPVKLSMGHSHCQHRSTTHHTSPPTEHMSNMMMKHTIGGCGCAIARSHRCAACNDPKQADPHSPRGNTSLTQHTTLRSRKQPLPLTPCMKVTPDPCVLATRNPAVTSNSAAWTGNTSCVSPHRAQSLGACRHAILCN